MRAGPFSACGSCEDRNLCQQPGQDACQSAWYLEPGHKSQKLGGALTVSMKAHLVGSLVSDGHVES